MPRLSSTHSHEDGVEGELAMNGRPSRPAHYSSRKEIHHHSQMQPALPCADIGNVCDPDAIRLGNRKLSLEVIRDQDTRLVDREPSRSIAMQGPQAILAHQVRNSVFAAGLTGLSKIEKDTGCAVDAMARDEGRANQSQQPGVLLGPIRNRVLEPFVIAARRNSEHSTHDLDGMLLSMRFNELIDPADILVAFSLEHRHLRGLFSMSRSSSVRFSCERNLSISLRASINAAACSSVLSGFTAFTYL